MARIEGATPLSDSETTAQRPLSGVRICFVFEYNLAHHTRYLREVRALQNAGAEVQLLTSHKNVEHAPPGIRVTIAPLKIRPVLMIGKSKARRRLVRRVENRLRRLARSIVKRVWPKPTALMRKLALRSLRSQVDIFWVSDYLSLPTVMSATKNTAARVVYETVDLVPEYPQHGEPYRARMLAGERALIGLVDGFITACDAYADYYMEEYGPILARRPVVCDNSPERMLPSITQSSRPIRILFFGQLMHDRPVAELIEAMALSRANVTLTFQGTNHLGAGPMTRIIELGLEDRVFLLDPCPPEMIVDYAAAYDLGIVALRGVNENERRATTSKLLTYAFAGLAVIASDLPGIARVVNGWNNGILVKGMLPITWARAFDKLAEMSLPEIDAMKQRSLDAACHFAWESQLPSFIAEFERALGRSEPLALEAATTRSERTRARSATRETRTSIGSERYRRIQKNGTHPESRRWVEAGPKGPNRFNMYLDPGSPGHGAVQMVLGTYDEAFMGALRTHPTLSGAVIWDIGAHIGYESLCFAKIVGEAGRVIAFEPNPANIDEWYRNISSNPELASRMLLRPEALSDTSGTAKFLMSEDIIGGTSSGSHLSDIAPPEEAFNYSSFSELSVSCARVDDLIASGEVAPPTVMKIDVEGAEAAVLRGALKTLRDHQPTLLIEIHHVRAMRQVDEVLQQVGYSVTLLESFEESPSRCFLIAAPFDRHS